MQSLYPAPCDIGAPARYTSWRHGQDRAFEKSQLTQKRFEVWALPTGIGKSLMAVVKARFNGGRAAILTSTKGLQDQYVRDFREIGMGDVRGMGNYPCPILGGGTATCDLGPCLDGQYCYLRDKGCPYYDAVREAKAAELVVTNYAWWMTQKRNGPDPLGALDLLVLDEGHEAAEEVTGFMRVTLNASELRVPAENLTIAEWRRWAQIEMLRVGARLAEMKGAGPIRRRLRELHARLKRLAESTGTWVWERGRHGSVVLEPLWPREYARDWLWGDIGKVVIASATVRPKDLEKLGLKPADYEWIEMPSPFPLSRRPVIHVPTARMNRFADAGMWGLWVDRIDQIIEGRLDRKGIIHTVSYERARYLLEHSQWRSLMVTHKDSKGTKDAFQRFNAMPAPAILVSPSIHTGFDFPYEAARYQIIGKVPFPDTRSAITKARIDDDPSYNTYRALQTLVQMAGRIVRAPDDFGETFVVDDTVRMVWAPGNRAFIPAYFLESFKSVNAVPPAPPLDESDNVNYEIDL